ncbi:MAG: Uma2 family endonuclease [Acidimicrobiia bacterium]
MAPRGVPPRLGGRSVRGPNRTGRRGGLACAHRHLAWRHRGEGAPSSPQRRPPGEHRVAPGGGFLPDPDCWVRLAAAEPTARLSERLSAWSPNDVLLVVEIADETIDQDLGPKATLYARAGYPCYWAVTRHGVYLHTGPSEAGYRTRVLYQPPGRLPVPTLTSNSPSTTSSHPADTAQTETPNRQAGWTMPIAMQ